MSAEIVQIRDYQHPREIARSNDRVEKLGLRVVTQALIGDSETGSDTAKAEYTAPDKDSA